jgi:uncharacterized protein (TIGR02246 family)
MSTTTADKDDAQIRECLNKWTRALHAKDLSALTALYGPDTVAFDLMPPTQVDASHYRKNFERWLGSMTGPIEYEIHELRVVTSGDVAFSHNLGHVKGTRANGEKADYWVRATVGFQKRDGKWLVIHDHVSMPIDMESGKAARDLRR